MDLLERGISSGLIKFDEDKKNVLYIQQNKRYRYTDPEEQVRVKTYLELVLNYEYNPARILLEAIVPDRTPNNLADIVIYSDDSRKEPYIVVECKQEEITDAEFIQAIEQGFGNANSLRAKFLWITSGIKSTYFNVADFKPMERESNKIADIPVYGSNKLLAAKYIKGGKDGFELEKVSEQDLTRIFKQAHDALWAGGKRNPSEAFDELDKVIFCKLWDERALRRSGEPYDFQVFTGEAPDKLLQRIKAIYNKGKEKDPEVFRDDIRLNAKELETVVGYLAKINLTATDLDSKGKAFETFMGSFFRGEFGQYFTPRNIVKFIVESLPITNESVVLDTSCGSGGFLLYALDKVRKLANDKADDGYFTKDSKEHWNFWHDFAEKRLYGVEISESIARTAKMNMIIHDDGHTNVVSYDGLESIEKLRETTKNQGFKKNRFEYIITNPPFGSTIKYSEHRYIEDFELGNKNIDWIEAKLKNIDLSSPRDSQSSEILFIERCHQYLRAGGILAIVVPDGILTNSSMQYVREWIEENYRIISVISLPQTAFAANGAGVKSSVMFLQKYSERDTAAIRAIKKSLQDNTFDKPEYGATIMSLEHEKQAMLKRGDITKQEIEEDFVRHIEALRAQGNLTKELERQLNKENKEKIKEYEKSESFQAWKKETIEEYNESISNIKESINDEYANLVKDRLTNYHIFMAIADDIGYDATGFETGNNDLKLFTVDLLKFIIAIGNGTESALISAPTTSKGFYVSYNSTINRLDPLYYAKDLFSFLRDTHHRVLPIYKVTRYIKTGFAAGKEQQDLTGNGIIQIRPTNIDDDRNLIFEKNVYINKDTLSNPHSDILNKGEVLFNNTNSQELVGKTTYFNLDGEYLCSNHITRIAVDSTIIKPEYLCLVLNQYQRGKIFYHLCTNWNNQSGVNAGLLRKLEIPVPDIDIQIKLIEDVNSKKQLATRLRAEAQVAIEEADKLVEQLIIGI